MLWDSINCVRDRRKQTNMEVIHGLPFKKNNPNTGLDRPRGFQEIEAPKFQENQHMKVVRLSALPTGLFYP